MKLKKLGPEKGIYVRVGSTNRQADQSLIAEMHRSKLNVCFDETTMPDLDRDAIDFKSACESFAPVRSLRAGDLRSLHLVTEYQGHEVATVGGVLCFGKDRQKWFPDAWIQCARFAGEDKRKILDGAEYRQVLPEAVADAAGFVRKHALRESEIGSLRREDRWNVPLVAVREALINAVVHADYSQLGSPVRVAFFQDRIEIDNPGLLPFGVTLDDLYRGVSKLRNRVIGRVFKELHLIEQWGSGVQRMLSECKEAGLPAPRFEELATHFRVTLFLSQTQDVQLDEVDTQICRLLKGASDGLSTSAIAQAIDMSTRATRTRLGSLVERGIVAVIGKGPRDPKRRYVIRKVSSTDFEAQEMR